MNESNFDQPKPLQVAIDTEQWSSIKDDLDRIFKAILKENRILIPLASQDQVHRYFTARHPETNQIIGIMELTKDGYISSLVEPEFQQKKVGTKLLKSTIEFAKQDPNIEKLSSVVRPNTLAEKSLVSNDFKLVAEKETAGGKRHYYKLDVSERE